MVYSLKLPGRTWFGNGALEAAEQDICSLGKRALIVTGKTVIQGEAFARLVQMLDGSGIAWAAFTGITGEPDDQMIDAGAKAFPKTGATT